MRRIAFATWENFDSDKGVTFESISDGTIRDVLNSMETAIDCCEAQDIDLVVQIGEEEILKYSQDYTAEGTASIIREGKAHRRVKEISICSVIDKNELEVPGLRYTSELSDI